MPLFWTAQATGRGWWTTAGRRSSEHQKRSFRSFLCCAAKDLKQQAFLPVAKRFKLESRFFRLVQALAGRGNLGAAYCDVLLLRPVRRTTSSVFHCPAWLRHRLSLRPSSPEDTAFVVCLPCVSTASAAKTPPLPCVSAAFVAETPPLSRVRPQEPLLTAHSAALHAPPPRSAPRRETPPPPPPPPPPPRRHRLRRRRHRLHRVLASDRSMERRPPHRQL